MTQPTYTELVELVVSMRTELDAIRAENETLKARVIDLEAQVRANSQNSSKPPSADGPAKPAPRSLRGKSKRKPGGQLGHQGNTLEQIADPDVVIRYEPSCCRGCGSDLTGTSEVDCSRRQVFDIPPIKVHVTEHQVITRRCSCGTSTSGAAPDTANAPVQYGPVMCAVIVYLFMGQFLSKKRTAQAIGELFGIPVSDGTVAAVTARAAGDLSEFLTQVTARVSAAPVVHFDETGLRCEGRNAWLHSASTPSFSLLFSHRRRGVEAMNAMGVLPCFTGTAVHDAWAPYDTYTDADHALCNAHDAEPGIMRTGTCGLRACLRWWLSGAVLPGWVPHNCGPRLMIHLAGHGARGEESISDVESVGGQGCGAVGRVCGWVRPGVAEPRVCRSVGRGAVAADGARESMVGRAGPGRGGVDAEADRGVCGRPTGGGLPGPADG